MLTKWLPLTGDERARAIAETSGRRYAEAETMIVNDDDKPGHVILTTTKGVDAAAVLRRGAGTEIARTLYNGEPHEWSIRIPIAQFRGWGGCFREQAGYKKARRSPSPWARGAAVPDFGGTSDGEE